jgi:hypothetical protein
MSDGGKGDSPRPFTVPKEEFNANFEGIFGKREPRKQWVYEEPKQDPLATGLIEKYKCWCYNCLNKIKNENGLPVTASLFIVCPSCGNKRCPKATDHNLDCTSCNDPGQPGSRYE